MFLICMLSFWGDYAVLYISLLAAECFSSGYLGFEGFCFQSGVLLRISWVVLPGESIKGGNANHGYV